MTMVTISFDKVFLMFCATSVVAKNDSSIEPVSKMPHIGPIRAQDYTSRDSIDQSEHIMSYNDSLKMFTDAKKDIEDVSNIIADLEKDINPITGGLSGVQKREGGGHSDPPGPK